MPNKDKKQTGVSRRFVFAELDQMADSIAAGVITDEFMRQIIDVKVDNGLCKEDYHLLINLVRNRIEVDLSAQFLKAGLALHKMAV